MQNILLISTIYPLPEGNKGTAVCHFFTREWVKMGYNVRVVHIQAIYPFFFYWLARVARKRIAAKTGAVVYTHRDSGVSQYIMNGVQVMRIAIFKLIPHGRFAKCSVKKAVETILERFGNEGFVPDVIIGHFPNPQIELLSLMKEYYPKTSTCIVMHGDTAIMQKVYGNRLDELMSKIDMWGFRSQVVVRWFEARFGKVENPFICYSGIPAQYITKHNVHEFSKPLHRFVYVGEMVERKYPEKVLEALQLAYPDRDYNITYIGDGQLLGSIHQEVEQNQLERQVRLLGRIPRDNIVTEYDKADCMVMISRCEAYGLVYLEAMARGCITIASRNEGFDGVIIDGENGFLCKAGDAHELASIIKRINDMTPEERQTISENAIMTAKRLTDEKAAKLYLDNVIVRMK